MSRFEAWCVHLSSLAVGLTGLVYAWMRYLATPRDPFAVVNHPWQPMVQHLHIWTAPFLVFGAGLIWRAHVWRHVRQGVRSGRRSGLTLMLTLLPMVVSGYLIQTAVATGWRQAWLGVHLGTAALWLLGYGVHLAALVRRRRRRRASGARAATAAAHNAA